LLGEKGAEYYMAANFNSPMLKFPTGGQQASKHTFDQIYEDRNGKTWYVVEAKGGSTKLTARTYSTEAFTGRVRQGTLPYLVATIDSMRKGYAALAKNLDDAFRANQLEYLYISIPYAKEEGARAINHYRFAKFDISPGAGS
jgi:hypothetical protein